MENPFYKVELDERGSLVRVLDKDLNMELLDSTIELQVSDVSSQKRANVRDVPADATVGELVEGLLAQLRMPATDIEGRPLTYGIRRQSDGQHIHASQRVAEALKTGDQIVLQPSVEAG